MKSLHFAHKKLCAALFSLALGLGLLGQSTVAQAVPIATRSVTSLAFGSLAMNAVSIVKTVTVTNTGDAALNISTVVLGGTNYGQFTLAPTSTCIAGASIPAGSSCTVNAKFSPTLNQAAGAKSATITLTDNATPATQVITLTGTTVNAPVTTASLSAPSLAFSVAPLTVASPTQTITLTNTGTLPLVVYSGAITLTGTNPTQFALMPTSTCISVNGVSVAVGASCTVDVQHKPPTTNVSGTNYTATVNLTLNTTPALKTVALTGKLTGAAATRSVTSLAFGSLAMNAVSAVQTVTVSNTGDAALNITARVLAGTGLTQFTVLPTSTCAVGASIVAGASCTLNVQFNPLTNQAAGAKSATITLTDNATPATQVITLTGTTVNAPVTTASLSAPSLAFSVAPLSVTTQTVTLTNTGTLPLIVYNGAITLTGTNATQFALLPSSTCLSANGVSIPVGGNCTVNVQYTVPSTAVRGTTYTAAVSLALNTSPTAKTINLTGRLAIPVVTRSSTSLTFAAQATNTISASQTVTVTNTGDAVLNITARTLSGLNPTQFNVLPASTCAVGTAIAAGSSCTLTIQFNPTQTPGGKAATLTLTDNAVPTTQVITLNGTSISASPPTVSFTSPANNSTMASPGNFTLTATASAPSSTVTQVDYYANGTMIGTATAAPYSYTWNTVPVGLYSLTALVTDALGRHAISPSVIVAVSSGATASTQAYYIHTDHLDTPRVITDTQGNKVWVWDNSDPFGDNVPNENPSGRGKFEFNKRYSGQYADKETGAFYNYFRDYDPASGRYIESDPIGLQGGINTYGYALQNPLRYTDPLGLEVRIVCRAAQIAGGIVNHCWVQTDTVSAGMGGDPNIPPGQQYEGYGMPVQVTDHSKDMPTQSTTMHNVDEQCVNNELKIGKPLGRFLPPFNQCQSFAYGVVNKCRTGPQMSPAP